MNQLLKDHFGFGDDPFNPKEDPETGFKFERYSLKNGLRIFEENTLTQYFIEKACFKECLDRTRQYLSRRTPNQGPPVFLIEGLRDSGVESLTGYVASLVARQAPGNTAGFETVRLIGENFADWLSSILLPVRLHIEKYGIADAAPLLPLFPNLMAPSNPNTAGLVALMTTLAGRLQAAPWLILMLNSISFDQQQQMKRLSELLVPMNIAPIFITPDQKVSMYFEAMFLAKGLALKLKPLDATEGLDILRARIGTFRKKPPAGRTDLFPYEEDAIRYLFSDGGKVVGYFLDICHGTLGMTADDIVTGKSLSPTVTWEHVKRYIEETLQQAAPKRKG
jgi:hypothetical protein